ncbi:unnamed protein product (macronuclear) [Paramecium tetraurelia]|uniref:Uncharacterized protein n=1 Tax=Paramecium tetraurelia TaxID=5888 RepID=A0DY43_PARTE|nr:uncharacterized protein GSPATT00002928001 [Paramecium tetraurelia]CAK87960.1 unnamed protein product [Paramecium tetraurelia]|eukprot:XP_001455357.1 hypothetical protein (macronuclear) [Paramecium tetraurelia strain d4-2]
MENFKLEQIEDYISVMEIKKEDSKKKGQLKQTQQLIEKIDDLNSISIIYKSIKQAEQYDAELQMVEFQQKLQLEEFDEAWEDLYKIEQDRIKEAENTIYSLHFKEMEQLQKQLQEQSIPKIKFSSDIIQKQALYNQLFRAGHYADADLVQKKLQEQIDIENQKWEKQHVEKIENKLNQLTKKQINELQVLKQKLNSQIQQFIINRDNQKQLLINKLQIIKVEKEQKINQDISKMNQQVNKLLQKLSQQQ